MKETTFTKQYLLLHEILNTLRKIGLSITGIGSQKEGITPVYEFQIASAHLAFGTLVWLLNDPENFNKKDASDINHFNNLIKKKNEIKTDKYSFEEVAAAIEILQTDGEIIKTIVGGFLEVDAKDVHLTEKGAYSLNTKKYLNIRKRKKNRCFK